MENNIKITYFSASWCGPCKAFTPVFDKVSAEFEDIEFVKVDIDDKPEVASEFKVMSIPTVVFEKDGQEIDRFSGAVSESVLRDKLKDFGVE